MAQSPVHTDAGQRECCQRKGDQQYRPQAVLCERAVNPLFERRHVVDGPEWFAFLDFQTDRLSKRLRLTVCAQQEIRRRIGCAHARIDGWYRLTIEPSLACITDNTGDHRRSRIRVAGYQMQSGWR